MEGKNQNRSGGGGWDIGILGEYKGPGVSPILTGPSCGDLQQSKVVGPPSLGSCCYRDCGKFPWKIKVSALKGQKEEEEKDREPGNETRKEAQSDLTSFVKLKRDTKSCPLICPLFPFRSFSSLHRQLLASQTIVLRGGHWLPSAKFGHL